MLNESRMNAYLELLYPDPSRQARAREKIRTVLARHSVCPGRDEPLSERTCLLITYADTLVRRQEPGLQTIKKFLDAHVGKAVSGVHLLPMYPYSSDDGFSVTDYLTINPALGSWQDADALAGEYDLMFDAVINHISRESSWFQSFLAGKEPYSRYFITADPAADYHLVTRPRSRPLLTPFKTASGTQYLWTTFSEDQIDLNYHCEDLLAEIIDVLLFYTEHGCRFIRMDAVGFLWKQPGTSCMHLPQTHALVKLLRLILEAYAPGTRIITETNVPQAENIRYFGDGTDEANLVYQFPLPPLTLFTMLRGNAEVLKAWLSSLPVLHDGTTFFNFLSSHDGIGLRPTEGILTREEQQFLVDAVLRSGGEVSYKDNGDGSRSPYELNINYQDALASPEDSDSIRISRFLAAETILISLQGVPGIYLHSLLGSRNDYYGKSVSGIPRRINREKLDADQLETALSSDTNRRIIFDELLRRLKIRRLHPAFSPSAPQRVLPSCPGVLALERQNTVQKERILVFINVSCACCTVYSGVRGTDLLTGCPLGPDVRLEPLQCVWLLPD